jgi:ATP-dependent DNA ligase
MPIFGRKPVPEPPSTPDEWRPQKFGAGRRAIRDAVIEPSWSGVRVLARLSGDATRFTDEDGVDCTEEFADASAAITAAALAGDFVLDGFLTVEATQDITGKPMADLPTPTKGQVMTAWIAGDRLAPPTAPKRELDPDRPIAFVAVDLLSIDGTVLLDIPLLERKRLLDGALTPSELARITPFVRPPIGNFLNTWRGIGFRALAYKAVNSRYTPDQRNDDWSILPMPQK